MKILIVHYNTPELTSALIFSIRKYMNDEIIIFENSDKRKLDVSLFENVKVLDNTAGQFIKFDERIKEFIKIHDIGGKLIESEHRGSNFGSYKHAISVQYCLEHIDDDILLLDSDILLKRNIKEIIDDSFIACGEYTKYRLLPFAAYFNNKLMKTHAIKFCDNDNIYPNPIPGRFYGDTGGSFLKECNAKGLKIKSVLLDKYIVHYGSGSWRDANSKFIQGDYKSLNKFEFLHKYKDLYQ